MEGEREEKGRGHGRWDGKGMEGRGGRVKIYGFRVRTGREGKKKEGISRERRKRRSDEKGKEGKRKK